MTHPSSAVPVTVRSDSIGSRIASGDLATAALIGIIFGLGFALRLLCSGGPLWNDEIWSLQNLASLRHFWQVLWGLSHDNNHFLNSLWLFFAAPMGGDSSWLRLPSIAAGALAIPAMACLGARQSRAAAVAAAALTACSFFQFTYSVEARGYATATLALIVAYAAMERAIETPGGRARWVLAAGAGIGFFSHLAMGPAIVLLAAVGFCETWRRRQTTLQAGGGRVHSSVIVNGLASAAATFCIFWPTALAMSPTLGFVAAGYVHQGGFTIGYFRPYSAAHAIGAMANLEMTTFGLDPVSRVLDALALVILPLLLLAAIAFAALPERRVAYAAFFIALPFAVLTLHPPNTHVARYFFAASPFLLLIAAEVFGRLWSFGRWPRVTSLAVLAGFLAGDGLGIARMQEGKRAPWSDALTAIANSGDMALASSFAFNVGKTVDYFNVTRGAKLQLIPVDRICERSPGWYIVEMPGDVAPDPTVALGGAKCGLNYTLNGIYDLHIPSQLPWALYRLQ